MEGWITKRARGRNAGAMMKTAATNWKKSWKRRYAALERSSAGTTLTYYTDERRAEAPKGSILLASIRPCEIDNKPFAFEVMSKPSGGDGEAFYARVESEAERDAWIAAVEAALERDCKSRRQRGGDHHCGGGGGANRKRNRARRHIDRSKGPASSADDNNNVPVPPPRRERKQSTAMAVFSRYNEEGENAAIGASKLAQLCYDYGLPLSEAEVNCAVELLDHTGTGLINFDDFLRWWRGSQRLSTLALDDDALDSRIRAMEMFRSFDIDRSGSIDREEGVLLFEEFQHAGLPVTADEIFAELDSDGDDLISLTEYVTWLELNAGLLLRHIDPEVASVLGVNVKAANAETGATDAAAAAAAAAAAVSTPPTEVNEQVAAETSAGNWISATTEDGRSYWYHAQTRATRWELPSEKLRAEIETRLHDQAEDTRRRQQERVDALHERQRARENAEGESTAIARECTARVDAWSRGKNLAGLLSTLHELIPDLRPADGAVEASVGTSLELKRAYLKAVRRVHPDKNPTASAEDKLVLTRVFEVLTASYQKSRSRR